MINLPGCNMEEMLQDSTLLGMFFDLLLLFRWLGSLVVKALDSRLNCCEFDSQPRRCLGKPCASCSHPCASVIKQYKLVPV